MKKDKNEKKVRHSMKKIEAEVEQWFRTDKYRNNDTTFSPLFSRMIHVFLITKGIRDSQFEEGIGDLKHQDMGVAMIVDDKDTLDCAAHTKVFIVIL